MSSRRKFFPPDKIKHNNTGKLKIGIVVSGWNHEITGKLLTGAYNILIKNKVKKGNITVLLVPGSFELPFGASSLGKKRKYNAIICLGCLIKGETPHFNYISSAVAHGIMNVGLQLGIPVIFGVLTTNNFRQAAARAGGKHGNKGSEAAETALRMA
ncbi:MAG: 6,7-dimethyl-8-ribityllumazine synthase [Bacteroidetes bacterium]|nr:6,7-dimethyl-8-ribityllumazine synthase [Bacteroidota bacterium]